jgi:hypothetical protein
MTTSNEKPKFEVSHWCDYARGVAEPGAVPFLEAALAESVATRKTVERFERVSSVGRADRAAEIPDSAMRLVKAVAGLGRRSSRRETAVAGPPPSLSFLACRVTFDSLRAAQAGTRDLAASDQRITSYRAREFSVHVKLEQETSPHGQVLVGQLLRHGPRPRPAPGVPVLVMSRGRAVGRSVTSRFGEFQAENLPPDPLELCLLVGPEECIDIPLGAHAQEA